MRYVLILLALLITNVANAMNCQELPDCASLGYSKGNDPNCVEDGYLNCPFDQDYKVCVQYNCEALGFTESDKTSWCADLIKCKGNEKMTLCQKACIATDYTSLKELAESGHCKVVTMRSDITLPPNQGITLATNTIIDGGNHTLNSSGDKGFKVYILNDKSGFKNIFIKHDQTQTQKDLYVFSSVGGSKTLQDVQISVHSDGTEGTQLFIVGTYEISGKFTVDIQTKGNHALSGWVPLIFNDADINVSITGTAGDGFVGKTDFINSHGIITTKGASIVFNQEITVSNSQIHLEAQLILWTNEKYGTIHLKDNAELKLTFSTLTGGDIRDIDKLAHIKFESSATAPATLIVEGDQKLDSADVTANNTANTVVLNGVTYHPKKATTTLLSEIPHSTDWEKVVQ